ncbi:unnamed protein product [Sympodiomycopsis kandeliae]
MPVGPNYPPSHDAQSQVTQRTILEHLQLDHGFRASNERETEPPVLTITISNPSRGGQQLTDNALTSGDQAQQVDETHRVAAPSGRNPRSQPTSSVSRRFPLGPRMFRGATHPHLTNPHFRSITRQCIQHLRTPPAPRHGFPLQQCNTSSASTTVRREPKPGPEWIQVSMDTVWKAVDRLLVLSRHFTALGSIGGARAFDTTVSICRMAMRATAQGVEKVRLPATARKLWKKISMAYWIELAKTLCSGFPTLRDGINRDPLGDDITGPRRMVLTPPILESTGTSERRGRRRARQYRSRSHHRAEQRNLESTVRFIRKIRQAQSMQRSSQALLTQDGLFASFLRNERLVPSHTDIPALRYCPGLAVPLSLVLRDLEAIDSVRWPQSHAELEATIQTLRAYNRDRDDRSLLSLADELLALSPRPPRYVWDLAVIRASGRHTMTDSIGVPSNQGFENSFANLTSDTARSTVYGYCEAHFRRLFREWARYGRNHLFSAGATDSESESDSG